MPAMPLLDAIASVARSESPGIRRADHGAGAARLFGGGGDPADAHPGPRRQKRGAAARRYQGLQVEADRFRALLFAEPQILISWAAGDNRPEISGDRFAADAAGAAAHSRSASAFGTWLPPEPALQMDHAVDALREAGEGFLLNLTTSNGHAIEAMGRAIGGQAIVRIRELGGVAPGTGRNPTCGTRRCWKRPKCCAASPPRCRGRSGPGAPHGELALCQRRLCAGPPRPPMSPDAIDRNLELLDSDQPRRDRTVR